LGLLPLSLRDSGRKVITPTHFRRQELKVGHDGGLRVDHHLLGQGRRHSEAQLARVVGVGVARPANDAGFAVDRVVGPVLVVAGLVETEQRPDSVRPDVDYCVSVPDFLKVSEKRRGLVVVSSWRSMV
jgi:hypothetical protein